MLVYDWMWRGQLTNQNLAQRGAQRCTEVRRGAWRCTEGCVEVHGGFLLDNYLQPISVYFIGISYKRSVNIFRLSFVTEILHR